ncbi:hypothetical protein MLD38_008622 [Melastoma candidum]|uniref:Uncharacterized protein n=1 Tax=Melastoma candidum TaxID=119954 RepID=A0ACB9S3F4_9MYRT|nr:hypothetical protein MLD38_008622 [Melastoma candidum]
MLFRSCCHSRLGWQRSTKVENFLRIFPGEIPQALLGRTDHLGNILRFPVFSKVSEMAFLGHPRWFSHLCFMVLFASLLGQAFAADINLMWNVAFIEDVKPLAIEQPVIAINGMFPGPLINATTNDFIHVNVFNNLHEPLLFTWNGIQQRLNSWQDGVSGTNCPILPGTNWTYVFQTKDQIGTFFYFPSINYQKAAGGYGPIRVNNREVISVPFTKPDGEYDLLIGDWHYDHYQLVRTLLRGKNSAFSSIPDIMLFNGKGPLGHTLSLSYESFNVTKGKTYRFRISNVGSALSFNFRIQKHRMLLVETEGSYTDQIWLDSLDVHVGQSYSVLVTADQDEADYYMVATPKLISFSNSSGLVGKGILRYANSKANITGPLPSGPDPFDMKLSLDQAKSIKWNMTTGAARPNPQGTFNVSNVKINQTFVLKVEEQEIEGLPRYTVNNVSYYRQTSTPLKLADYKGDASKIYQLDAFPVWSVNTEAANGISVVSGNHKEWLEIVFENPLDVMDSWHLNGYSFFVVGFGDGVWGTDNRTTYNMIDSVVRSTVQVYPNSWTAVYVFLDNPGMWNLRSQNLRNWYLGEELYIRVFDPDTNPAKEKPPPDNLLLCGIYADANATHNSPHPKSFFGW